MGALLILLALALLGWLLPAVLPWALLLVVLGLVVSAAIQAALGHRGRCWAQRTIRWWLGPAGALVDPFDAG